MRTLGDTKRRRSVQAEFDTGFAATAVGGGGAGGEDAARHGPAPAPRRRLRVGPLGALRHQAGARERLQDGAVRPGSAPPALMPPGREPSLLRHRFGGGQPRHDPALRGRAPERTRHRPVAPARARYFRTYRSAASPAPSCARRTYWSAATPSSCACRAWRCTPCARPSGAAERGVRTPSPRPAGSEHRPKPKVL